MSSQTPVKVQNQELAVSLAALLLHSAEKDVTSNAMTKVLNTAGIKVDAFWPIVMARALSNSNIEDLIMNPTTPVQSASATTGSAATQEEEKKEEEKKEEEEEEEDFGGFGDLF
ncbi:60S acidic ribosomal protein P1 [Entamoeba marina]